MNIRLLLVDDHSLFRLGIHTLLSEQPDMEVVAEADNGRTAVKLAQADCPDVVVMDISMPNLNGIEATSAILAQCPATKVVALSMHNEERYVLGMLKAGASAYLLKDSPLQDVVSAIRTVNNGGTFLSPAISGVVLEGIRQPRGQKQGAASQVLTPREREVLQLIAEARTSGEIADQLSLSVKTVYTHRRNIMEKLQARNVADLTKIAIQEGLTSLQRI